MQDLHSRSEEWDKELREAQDLLQEELARQVGLPGLRIQEQPGQLPALMVLFEPMQICL